jgi:hypothetical protein
VRFHEMRERALAVRRKYAALERATYSREWTAEEIALGFVGETISEIEAAPDDAA